MRLSFGYRLMGGQYNLRIYNIVFVPEVPGRYGVANISWKKIAITVLGSRTWYSRIKKKLIATWIFYTSTVYTLLFIFKKIYIHNKMSAMLII